VEHLFDSLAAHCGARTIAILLTGMGQDGAVALKRLRDLGALTIAQDQASSVVHGMPGEAIRLGAATQVMNPRDIAAALPALVSGRQDDKGRSRHGSP
jgi:two-component system chemotaxis response regulator CheB